MRHRPHHGLRRRGRPRVRAGRARLRVQRRRESHDAETVRTGRGACGAVHFCETWRWKVSLAVEPRAAHVSERKRAKERRLKSHVLAFARLCTFPLSLFSLTPPTTDPQAPLAFSFLCLGRRDPPRIATVSAALTSLPPAPLFRLVRGRHVLAARVQPRIPILLVVCTRAWCLRPPPTSDCRLNSYQSVRTNLQLALKLARRRVSLHERGDSAVSSPGVGVSNSRHFKSL